MKYIKYQIYCLEEACNKNVILEEGQPVPDKCPTDTNHPVQPNSASIVKVIDADIKPVRQVLGEDNYSMHPVGFVFTALAGQTSNHDKKLDIALAVRGGLLDCDNAVRGDNIKVMIIDKEAKTGLPNKQYFEHPDFSYTEDGWPILNLYVPEWFVMPGKINELIDVSIGKLPIAGLYARLVYISTGNTNVTGSLNFVSYVESAE